MRKDGKDVEAAKQWAASSPWGDLSLAGQAECLEADIADGRYHGIDRRQAEIYVRVLRALTEQERAAGAEAGRRAQAAKMAARDAALGRCAEVWGTRWPQEAIERHGAPSGQYAHRGGTWPVPTEDDDPRVTWELDRDGRETPVLLAEYETRRGDRVTYRRESPESAWAVHDDPRDAGVSGKYKAWGVGR